MVKNLYRHGDLGLTQLLKAPRFIKKVFSGDKYVLAEGEATGHKHLLTADPKTKLKIYEDAEGRKYISTEGATLTHEEHKPLTIGKGLYVIKHEKEYDYFEEEQRKVID